jgi:hypothetical protein
LSGKKFYSLREDDSNLGPLKLPRRSYGVIVADLYSMNSSRAISLVKMAWISNVSETVTVSNIKY